jgi:hypothetical protein
MRIQMALNHRERLLCMLKDTYSACVTYHHTTCDELIKRVGDKLKADEGLKRCPQWVRTYLSACDRMLLDMVFRYHIEWRIWLDDKLVLSKDVPDGRWHECKGGAYVYKNAPEFIFSNAKDKNESSSSN